MTALPLAVTMGDPAGIGGECLVAAWAGLGYYEYRETDQWQ